MAMNKVKGQEMDTENIIIRAYSKFCNKEMRVTTGIKKDRH